MHEMIHEYVVLNYATEYTVGLLPPISGTSPVSRTTRVGSTAMQWCRRLEADTVCTKSSEPHFKLTL